jgi:hypothetical protein
MMPRQTAHKLPVTTAFRIWQLGHMEPMGSTAKPRQPWPADALGSAPG